MAYTNIRTIPVDWSQASTDDARNKYYKANEALEKLSGSVKPETLKDLQRYGRDTMAAAGACSPMESHVLYGIYAKTEQFAIDEIRNDAPSMPEADRRWKDLSNASQLVLDTVESMLINRCSCIAIRPKY